MRIVRGVLLRAVRVPPREDGDRRLIIVLWTAWNMGGTIRAAFNLAEYMTARGWQVEIISGYRDRDQPFFGSFPAGVPVFDLDDRRKGGLLRKLLRKRPSHLMPATERAATTFNLWTDIQLVRRLRGRAGILVGTRPGVNLMLARLQAPGLRTVGLEQMNLSKHGRKLRRSMRAHYPQARRARGADRAGPRGLREAAQGAGAAAAPHPQHGAAAARRQGRPRAPRPSTRPGASATRRASSC